MLLGVLSTEGTENMFGPLLTDFFASFGQGIETFINLINIELKIR